MARGCYDGVLITAAGFFKFNGDGGCVGWNVGVACGNGGVCGVGRRPRLRRPLRRWRY